MQSPWVKMILETIISWNYSSFPISIPSVLDEEFIFDY